MVSECDKEKYHLLLDFILHEVFVIRTVEKIHLLVISENDVELLTIVLTWNPVELAKQYLSLLLKTVEFWGKDLLISESELEDLKIKGCAEVFNFRKLLPREEKLSAIILKFEDLLTLEFLCI